VTFWFDLAQFGRRPSARRGLSILIGWDVNSRPIHQRLPMNLHLSPFVYSEDL